MVNVVITGGAGFLGSRLARELLAAGSLDVAGGGARPLSRVTLIDQAPVPPDLAADERVTAIRGDLGELLDPRAAGPDTLSGAEVIFHLAAAVSGECEADFDLGIRANLRATEALLASCRALGTEPGSGVLQLARRVRRLRRPPAPRGRRRPDPAQPADQLRRAEGHRRAVAGRLHQEGIPARPGAAPGERQRAPGAAERRGVRLHVRRHPGAAGRAARDLPGRPGHRGRARLAGQGHRRAAVRGYRQRPGLGRPQRGQPARAHHQPRGHGRRRWPGSPDQRSAR